MRKSRLRWRLFKNEEFLGEMKTEEVAKITGIGPHNISTYADLGSQYKGVYRIERIEEPDFATEWGSTTAQLLGK